MILIADVVFSVTFIENYQFSTNKYIQKMIKTCIMHFFEKKFVNSFFLKHVFIKVFVKN